MGTIALLNPKGLIALQERNLMIAIVLIMLLLVIPLYIFTFFVARKYRAGNQKTVREPDAGHSRTVMIFWWIIPAIFIVCIGAITWKSAHELDPSQSIESTSTPITIQVVALQWKWLFIYPQQHIATVNFIEIPVNTPVRFELTADNAPMNSFWIPQLGGQMYAMTGMSSQLNLIANTEGDFVGSGAEMSGPGFAGMKFTVRSASLSDFSQWAGAVQESPNILTKETYDTLVEPSQDVPPTYYSGVENNFYDTIMMKYMAPMSTSTDTMEGMQGMSM